MGVEEHTFGPNYFPHLESERAQVQMEDRLTFLACMSLTLGRFGIHARGSYTVLIQSPELRAGQKVKFFTFFGIASIPLKRAAAEDSESLFASRGQETPLYIRSKKGGESG